MKNRNILRAMIALLVIGLFVGLAACGKKSYAVSRSPRGADAGFAMPTERHSISLEDLQRLALKCTCSGPAL